jgi:hypothetical protein
MKIKLNVHEMFDAEATHVSMVPRGANTMPFKKIASADAEQGGYPMLNFKAGLMKTFGIEDAKPEVLAIVVKGEATDADKTRLKDRGFSIESPQAYDGTTVFIQKDAELGGEGQLAIQMDERTCVVCTFAPFAESDSFKENIDQQGFLPGFDTALTVLRDTVFNALFDSDDAPEAAKKVGTAVKEFGEHVSGLAKAIPKEAFKMDPSLVKLSDPQVREAVAKATEINIKILVEGAPTPAEAGSPADATQTEFDSSDGVDSGAAQAVSDMNSPQAKTAMKIGEKTYELTADQLIAVKAITGDEDENKDKDDEPKTDKVDGDDKSTDGKEGEPKADEPVAASKDGDGSTVTEPTGNETMLALKGLLNDFEKKITGEITKVSESVTTLAQRVEATELVARKADEALNGTINASANGDPQGGDNGAATGAQIPLIDTGMQKVSLRAAK